MRRFLGKVALVIGGNSGIGLATAQEFAREGAQVIITGRDAHTLQRAAREIELGTLSVRSDISSLAQISTLFSDLRQNVDCIDVLFINAGVLAMQPIEAVTEAVWDEVLDTNLKGVFFTVQAALPMMASGSSIVITGSTAGSKGVPTAAAYCASKAGVRGLVRSLAAELLDKGIRVNLVSPGPTDTPIFHRATGVELAAVPALRQSEIESVPMKRMGEAKEVAAAVLFLASTAAAFITGIDFPVDGGTVSL